MILTSVRIAIVGGTGDLGSAIAGRLAQSGCSLILGSRHADKAVEAAARLGGDTTGMANGEAAAAGDLIIVTVPFAAQEGTLREIAPHAAGKIVIDTTVPLRPPRVMRVQLPVEGSAALRAQALLGEDVRVVSAHKLAQDADVACDVLVFSDDKEARGVGIELVGLCGLRGLHAGSLANSAAAEAMTSVLIFINKNYAADGVGIEITGPLKARDD